MYRPNLIIPHSPEPVIRCSIEAGEEGGHGKQQQEGGMENMRGMKRFGVSEFYTS